MRFLAMLALSLAWVAPAGATMRYMLWDDPAQPVYYDINCVSPPAQSVLVAFFDAPVTDITGALGYVDFCTRPENVREWWRFNDPASCRADSLRVSIDFSAGPSYAAVPWSSQAVVTHTLEFPYGGDWDMGRIWVEVTDPGGGAGPLTLGSRYFAFKVIFGNPNPTCDGCAYPACFVLNGLVLHHSGRPYFTDMDYRNWAAWQGGTQGCPFIVQNESSTWGRVKSFYR